MRWRNVPCVGTLGSPSRPCRQDGGCARYQQAWSIVERAAHPHLGLLVDGFNTFSQSGDLSGLRDLPGDRIFFVRVADAQRGSTDEAFAFWYRNLPAQGDLDVVGFLEQVLLTGYSGTISLARGNDVLRATPNRRTGIDAMRAALFLESQVRGRLETRRIRRVEHFAGGGSGHGGLVRSAEGSTAPGDSRSWSFVWRTGGQTSRCVPGAARIRALRPSPDQGRRALQAGRHPPGAQRRPENSNPPRIVTASQCLVSGSGGRPPGTRGESRDRAAVGSA